MNPVVLPAARMAGALARRLGVGGGTSLPGLVVERTAPGLVGRLAARLGRGVVLVSGTNGKTTTCRILAELLQACGLSVVQNRTGSNLMRGIAAALVNAPADAFGPQGVGIFEVDEATLPEAVARLSPRAVALLNLFRDQLDRYGEVDAVVDTWRRAAASLPPNACLVLNADDPVVAGIDPPPGRHAVYYGIDDRTAGSPELEHAADFTDCLACGSPLEYGVAFFGHLGHYRCPGCGRARPQPQVRCAAAAMQGLAGSAVRVQAAAGEAEVQLVLPGLYNVYNLLGAVATVDALGLKVPDLGAALSRLRPAFGRADRVEAGGKAVVTLLTKNPVGANQVLRTLAAEPGPKCLLLALNDGLADGRDVSWVWDVDYELLRGRVALAVASGRRAADLALRLKHAGWFEPDGGLEDGPVVIADLRQALTTALYRLLPGQTLYVLPTYTAMLYLREQMAALGLAAPYWREAVL